MFTSLFDGYTCSLYMDLPRNPLHPLYQPTVFGYFMRNVTVGWRGWRVETGSCMYKGIRFYPMLPIACLPKSHLYDVSSPLRRFTSNQRLFQTVPVKLSNFPWAFWKSSWSFGKLCLSFFKLLLTVSNFPLTKSARSFGVLKKKLWWNWVKRLGGLMELLIFAE